MNYFYSISVKILILRFKKLEVFKKNLFNNVYFSENAVTVFNLKTKPEKPQVMLCTEFVH